MNYKLFKTLISFARRHDLFFILRGLLPIPEPFSRRRFTNEATTMIDKSIVSIDEFSRESILKSLALRGLWLQKQTRLVTRLRIYEAAALLARCGLENAMVAIIVSDPSTDPSIIKQSVAMSLKKSIEMLYKSVGFDINFRDYLTKYFETPNPMPKLGNNSVKYKDLYSLYTFLSEYFSHTNGSSLMRFGNPNGGFLPSPWYPWTKYGPANLADGCAGIVVGLLALEIEPFRAEQFKNYATEHLKRVLSPMLNLCYLGLKYQNRAEKRKSIFICIKLIVLVKEVVKVVDKDEYLTGSLEERLIMIKDMFQKLGDEFIDSLGSDAVDAFVKLIVQNM